MEDAEMTQATLSIKTAEQGPAIGSAVRRHVEARGAVGPGNQGGLAMRVPVRVTLAQARQLYFKRLTQLQASYCCAAHMREKRGEASLVRAVHMLALRGRINVSWI